jgi:hypothetical protein
VSRTTAILTFIAVTAADVSPGGGFTGTGANTNPQCNYSYLSFTGTLAAGQLGLSIFSQGQLGWTFHGARL